MIAIALVAVFVSMCIIAGILGDILAKRDFERWSREKDKNNER